MAQMVSVHQPNFMLWVKLLDKILASNVYVAYDTAKFTRSEYHSRQKVKQSSGPVWLSVPVANSRNELIAEVRIDNSQPFRQKHLRLLRREYGRAPYFDEVYPMVDEVYARNHEFLVDLSVDLIEAFCRYLGSPARIVRASSLEHEGDNTERLAQLVRAAGGDIHLTSTFDSPRRYIDWPLMEAAGISIYRQVFDHPTYDQLWGDFVPNLSALDMLFCCGPETRTILEAGRRLVDVSTTGATAAADGLQSRSRSVVEGG